MVISLKLSPGNRPAKNQEQKLFTWFFGGSLGPEIQTRELFGIFFA
jgi:hypothetical protein